MFSIPNRRYTGAKTKLLDSIDTSILKAFDYRDKHNLSFFDVFSGTGVVSEYFVKNRCVINDFLHSNYVIYQGFFAQEKYDKKKLKSLSQEFQGIDSKSLKENYYSKYFGINSLAKNDSKMIDC